MSNEWGEASRVLAEERLVEVAPGKLKELIMSLILKERQSNPSTIGLSDLDVFKIVVDKIKKSPD